MKRANGTGSVSRLSGKRRKPYVATITKGWELDGDKHRQLRVTLGYYESRRAAREALDAYLQAPIERPRITLKELYDEWSAVKYPRISKSTAATYTAAWAKIEPIHDMIVRDIRTPDMQRIIDENAHMSMSALKDIRSVLHMLLRQAVQQDIVHKNYASFIVLPKKVAGEREVFSDLEIATLFRHDDDPWAQTVLILIYTGFRVSEMLSLTRFNVDLENGVLIGGMKTEAGRNRAVPIHPRILPYIKAWMAKGGETVICAPQGGPMPADRYRKRYYYPTLERLGIRRLTPHCCRHTLGTMLDRAGAPTTATQKILGHADYTTTANIYTHPDFVALKNAMDLLE
jgi:integrase